MGENNQLGVKKDEKIIKKPNKLSLVKNELKKERKDLVKEIKFAFKKENGKTNYPLLLFYLAWLECGLNAMKAYKKLHPQVKNESAKVLGSKMLTKINQTLILEAYSLDVGLYFSQLKDGILANRIRAEIVDRDDKGRPVYKYFDEPDHMTRKPYHDKLGRLLHIEANKDSTSVAVQVNNNITPEKLPDEQLDSIIGQ